MERKLAAIFSADVKGYSRLMGDDEIATVRTLTAYREVMATLIHAHRGRVVDSPGDNLLAEFVSAVEAVQCAVAIQHELTVRNTESPVHRQMAFRIGINVGDVLTEDGRLYGDGVNITAQLEGLAEAGGICLSETAHTGRKATLALGGLLLLAIVVVIAMQHLSLRPPAPSAAIPPPQSLPLALPDKPSIVVLPFDNMSKDPEQDYFSNGITEVLTSDLSRISTLFVIAHNTAFTYKGKANNVQNIGKELGVRYVLEGSVQKASDQVRIVAQLIDTTTASHLWSERYDRPLKDIFALQDEIVQKSTMTG